MSAEYWRSGLNIKRGLPLISALIDVTTNVSISLNGLTLLSPSWCDSTYFGLKVRIEIFHSVTAPALKIADQTNITDKECKQLVNLILHQAGQAGFDGDFMDCPVTERSHPLKLECSFKRFTSSMYRTLTPFFTVSLSANVRLQLTRKVT